MTYDVDTPKERFNTEITREYFRKYNPEPTKHTILGHWSILQRPDSDIVYKTTAGAVNGSFAALIASVHSNARHTKGPYTLIGIAAKSYKHGTPWIVTGAAYGLTLSMITQIRHEESPVNHMIAGYAAGTMLGSWYKWPMLGVWSGGIMAIVGGLVKYWHDKDMLHDKPIRRPRLFNMYRRGWFIDRPNAEGDDDAEIDVSFRSNKA